MSPSAIPRNLVLIGMAGVGKSTVGVLLAKALSRPFVDTDLIIQAAEGRRLQDILDADGLDAFRRTEERHVLALDVRDAVIATGGSVVYSDAAMAHLKRYGVAIYLQLDPATLEARVRQADPRGLAIAPGQTFQELYRERKPLYERHADITIDCAGLTHDEVVARIVRALG
jgi:shikimate kinase